MLYDVRKEFKTVNREFVPGDRVTEYDVVGHISLSDLINKGFIGPSEVREEDKAAVIDPGAAVNINELARKPDTEAYFPKGGSWPIEITDAELKGTVVMELPDQIGVQVANEETVRFYPKNQVDPVRRSVSGSYGHTLDEGRDADEKRQSKTEPVVNINLESDSDMRPEAMKPIDPRDPPARPRR